MNTEELREQAEDFLNFDAHEFDGLRDALEQEAKGLFAKADQFVRENPLLCMGLAMAAGLTVSALLARRCGAEQSEEPVDSRRM